MEDAQAETGVWTPARAPILRPRFAAGALAMSIGTVKGLTRRGPFSFWMSHWDRVVCRPPMPEAQVTPRRS